MDATTIHKMLFREPSRYVPLRAGFRQRGLGIMIMARIYFDQSLCRIWGNYGTKHISRDCPTRYSPKRSVCPVSVCLSSFEISGAYTEVHGHAIGKALKAAAGPGRNNSEWGVHAAERNRCELSMYLIRELDEAAPRGMTPGRWSPIRETSVHGAGECIKLDWPSGEAASTNVNDRAKSQALTRCRSSLSSQCHHCESAQRPH